MMTIGLYVDSKVDIAREARAAEDAGLSHLWLYDSPLLFGDTTVACLMAGQATSRITIGPGVANPLQRPAAYTAQAMATLNVAMPGRVVLGLGIGNSARHSLALPPAKLADLRAHTEVVRAMLAGDDAVVRTDDQATPVRFIHQEGPWLNLDDPIEIWLSAFGPVGQKIAGAVADAVLVRWEGAEAVDVVRRRLAAADRAPGLGEPGIGVVYAMAPIADDAELETQAMRDHIGPLVVSRLRYLTANAESPDEVPAAFRDGFVAYKAYRAALDPASRHLDNYRGYLVHTPPDLERFVTPASMRAVALLGRPERIAEELTAMAAAGVTHCSTQMAGDQAAWCARMATEVFPLLGARDGAGSERSVEVAA